MRRSRAKKEPLLNIVMLQLVKYVQEFGRFQRNARLYLLSYALSGVTTGIILVLYNLYLSSLGYATDFIGLVLFMATLGAACAIFPAGACVDRFGGKSVVIWGSAGVGLAGVGQMLLRQPIPLLISVFLVGVAGAFVLVVNAPFLTANSTPVERPQLFSLAIVVSLVTTVFGQLLGGVLPLWLRNVPWLMSPLPPVIDWALVAQPAARSYQLSLLLAGIIAAPSFIPLFLIQSDRPERSRTLTAPTGQHFPLKRRLTDAVAAIRKLDKRTFLFSPLVGVSLIYALFGAGAGLFLPYANIYFVKHLGASSALFGVIDGTANTVNALATLGAPWLALRLGQVRTLVFTRLLSIPVLLALGLTSFLPLATFLYPLRQATMGMSAGLLQVFSMEAVERQQRGLANSSYQAAFQVAWALTTPVGGFIIARSGFAPAFIAAACFYLLAIALLWIRFGRKERKEREALKLEKPEISGFS